MFSVTFVGNSLFLNFQTWTQNEVRQTRLFSSATFGVLLNWLNCNFIFLHKERYK